MKKFKLFAIFAPLFFVATIGISRAEIGTVIVTEKLITDAATNRTGIDYQFYNQPLYDTQIFMATNPMIAGYYSDLAFYHSDVALAQVTRPGWGLDRVKLGYGWINDWAYRLVRAGTLHPSAWSLFSMSEDEYYSVFGNENAGWIYVYYNTLYMGLDAWKDRLIPPNEFVDGQFLLWGAAPNSSGLMLDSTGQILPIALVTSPVPEPSSGLLIMLGVTTLLLAGRLRFVRRPPRHIPSSWLSSC